MRKTTHSDHCAEDRVVLLSSQRAFSTWVRGVDRSPGRQFRGSRHTVPRTTRGGGPGMRPGPILIFRSAPHRVVPTVATVIAGAAARVIGVESGEAPDSVPQPERAVFICLCREKTGDAWYDHMKWRVANDSEFIDPGIECSWKGLDRDDGRNFIGGGRRLRSSGLHARRFSRGWADEQLVPDAWWQLR